MEAAYTELINTAHTDFITLLSNLIFDKFDLVNKETEVKLKKSSDLKKIITDEFKIPEKVKKETAPSTKGLTNDAPIGKKNKNPAPILSPEDFFKYWEDPDAIPICGYASTAGANKDKFCGRELTEEEKNYDFPSYSTVGTHGYLNYRCKSCTSVDKEKKMSAKKGNGLKIFESTAKPSSTNGKPKGTHLGSIANGYNKNAKSHEKDIKPINSDKNKSEEVADFPIKTATLIKGDETHRFSLDDEYAGFVFLISIEENDGEEEEIITCLGRIIDEDDEPVCLTKKTVLDDNWKSKLSAKHFSDEDREFLKKENIKVVEPEKKQSRRSNKPDKASRVDEDDDK